MKKDGLALLFNSALAFITLFILIKAINTGPALRIILASIGCLIFFSFVTILLLRKFRSDNS